jgi:hypothetical protein
MVVISFLILAAGYCTHINESEDSL